MSAAAAVNCQSYDAGACGLGLHGGRPPLIACRVCQRRRAVDPRQGPILRAPRPATEERVEQPRIVWGPVRLRRLRRLWALIHRWPFVRGVAGAEAMLGRVARRLPCGRCRANLAADLLADPPDLSSPAALFAWGVRLHDRVSVRRGEPTIGVERARAIWEG